MGASVGEHHEGRQIAAVIEQGVQLERAFLFPVRRPRIERETHIYKRRVERIQIETMTGGKLPALLKERVKYILEDIGITFVVGISQRASSNTGQSKMIPLPVVTPEADFDVTEAVQAFRLGKQQHQKLLPAGKTLCITITIVTSNILFETVLTNELH